MKRIIITTIGLFWVLSHILLADNRIIMYLKHAPDYLLKKIEKENDTMTDDQINNFEEKMNNMNNKTPGDISKKLAKYSIKNNLKPPLSGIVAIYGGYMDISDRDGLFSFPLRHTTPKIYVAITPKIKLIHVKGNTKSHREYQTEENNPTQIYSMEIKKDPKNFTFWAVQKQQLPANKKINPLTVIILTKPKNIVITEGKSWIIPNVQLVLPTIFLLNRSNTEYAVLQSLEIRQYFEPIITNERKISDKIHQKLISNL